MEKGAGAADSMTRSSLNPRVHVIIQMCASLLITVAVGGAVIYGMTYYDSGDVSLYVQDLYVASLDRSLNNNNRTRTTTFNSSVLVELKLKREYALRGLQFKELQMTLFYGQSGSRNIPVGSSMVEEFSMRRKMKRVHVIGKVEAVAMPWQEAVQAVTAGNVIPIVVELRKPPDNNFRYTADVLVNASGHIKEPIKFIEPPTPVYN